MGKLNGPRERPQRADAFTLVEVLIAMAVLAVGLLALLGMQVYAMRGGQSGRHTTRAALVARAQLEVFERLDWSDPALAATNGFTNPTPVTDVVQAPIARTEQIYNVSWRITDVNPNLKAIDVRVTWSEPGRPNRTYVVSTMRHNDP